jgi:hypothetical protein
MPVISCVALPIEEGLAEEAVRQATGKKKKQKTQAAPPRQPKKAPKKLPQAPPEIFKVKEEQLDNIVDLTVVPEPRQPSPPRMTYQSSSRQMDDYVDPTHPADLKESKPDLAAQTMLAQLRAARQASQVGKPIYTEEQWVGMKQRLMDSFVDMEVKHLAMAFGAGVVIGAGLYHLFFSKPAVELAEAIAEA